MRPHNLKFPFRWESREPLLLDGVLYVPKCYDRHDLWPKEELKEFLSLFKSIAVEYCSGNGLWVAEKAKECPSTLWIAVEKRFDRVQRIWAKKHNFSLQNLLVVCGDAATFTKYYLRSDLVDQIFINFPDPWPKARHAKKRIVQDSFVREMARISKIDAEVVLVTDDEPYSSQMSVEMLKKGDWASSFSVIDWPEYGTSFFESLWKNQGKEIRYMKFKKIQENGMKS
jgi:tRNA (guanine-N7-)-methyltransferase